jgi:ubiquinone/menaquinone biosynthesis C-methylase UbiE
VYAIDTVEEHLEYLRSVCESQGIDNIETVEGTTDELGLEEGSLDVAFLCSLYHIIYTTYKEPDKDRYLESVKRALKPDGRLVIVDNALVESPDLPYFGPYIAKELIVGQLHHYGFRLVESHQFIPQRYVLIFEKQ